MSLYYPQAYMKFAAELVCKNTRGSNSYTFNSTQQAKLIFFN